MFYLTNAFSINMLDFAANLCFHKIEVSEVQSLIGQSTAWVSAIGHQSTADLLTSVLGSRVKMNRTTVKMQNADFLIVAQYVGERLPEGVTELPEGSTLQFWKVFEN